ncbi:MAG: NADH-quinone oxidoreductase subunit NuoG [Anaerolineae bacterium]
MADTVKIYIDDQAYDVPKGANLVDAAKQLGNDIPVFCYHPKMKPVGMCRMCLVEMGNVQRDRATNEVMLDDKGNPQIRWMPKLQTACTTTVSDGLVIRTGTKPVADARKNVIEFLLTSHPLDCPICDKGGECPLQNQTLEYGPGVSRMVFDDKMHLDKHVPLGDLIFLDEERCIQCARCVRFQDEIVGDPVLGFHERGRSLQIVTMSDPGFDTYFSGNTTDICPVGALTTEDFRFGARPWELTNVPSICPHCPVGCNITLSTRLDRDFDGRAMIKRVMPRQNEQVNEIWICDKGRFGHHFTRSDERLMQPLVNGAPASWADALRAVADALKSGGEVAAIAGSQMSNEDLWTLRKLVGEGRKGAWPPTHGGIELLAQVGVGAGTNLSDLKSGDAVLVIASDLEEEAPVWRLRIKSAHDRGAYVVVANTRHTRMDDFASATIRYEAGQAAAALGDAANADIVGKLTGAANLVVVAGAEGLTFDGSRALMQAAANLLISSGHVGKPNSGLMATLPGANGMGLHYLGFSPEASEDIMQAPPNVLIVAQADVFADDPNAAEWLDKVDTVIALSLFPDELTAKAKVALPIQSFAERDGTFTNGERRVQRFYTAQGPMGSALPAWRILSRVGELLGQGRAKASAAAVMLEISQNVAAFAGTRYAELAKVPAQFPDVGGQDLYYGGTAYKNTGGIGVQIATEADGGTAVQAGEVKQPAAPKVGKGNLMVVPTVRLYNRESTFLPSVEAMMAARTSAPYVEINAADAKKLKIADGDLVEVSVGASTVQARAHVNGAAPAGTVLLPRHLADAAAPLAPAPGEVRKV